MDSLNPAWFSSSFSNFSCFHVLCASNVSLFSKVVYVWTQVDWEAIARRMRTSDDAATGVSLDRHQWRNRFKNLHNAMKRIQTYEGGTGGGENSFQMSLDDQREVLHTAPRISARVYEEMISIFRVDPATNPPVEVSLGAAQRVTRDHEYDDGGDEQQAAAHGGGVLQRQHLRSHNYPQTQLPRTRKELQAEILQNLQAVRAPDRAAPPHLGDPASPLALAMREEVKLAFVDYTHSQNSRDEVFKFNKDQKVKLATTAPTTWRDVFAELLRDFKMEEEMKDAEPQCFEVTAANVTADFKAGSSKKLEMVAQKARVLEEKQQQEKVAMGALPAAPPSQAGASIQGVPRQSGLVCMSASPGTSTVPQQHLPPADNQPNEHP
eukprot:scaffold13155_cov18-Tisochrysis_lutea.AAC.1